MRVEEGTREPDDDGARSPWVASSALRRIVSEAGADPGLLDDLADVRGALMDEA